MNAKSRLPIAFVMTLFLAACAGQKPQTEGVKAEAKPKPRPSYSMKAPHPPRLPGEWTVADILQDYGSYAEHKLRPYFKKANVPFPPQQMILVGLKEEKKLELWAKGDEDFKFIRDYDIQAASGVAGPKLRQGDRQVPEGVYRIVMLNPNSHYHLSMKINYPNDFDLYHADQEGRYEPGSDIFIHGKAASIGCLAMGDETIEELFVLTALTGKENVKVVIAPRDPRRLPLDDGMTNLPEWTDELYSEVSREIRQLSKRVEVSANSAQTPEQFRR